MANEKIENGKRRQGGRPAISDPRKITVSTRVNREEFARVMQRMRDTNLTRSEALRLLLLNEHLPQKIAGGIDITVSQAYQKLQPLQSNLNQIAHALNGDRTSQINPDGLKAFVALIRKIEAEVKEIRQEIIQKKAEV